ncbi:MAG: hypothetical protein EOO09_22085 [Chitinophagaceae bacterium]|nr:MAG: hypothetical protein EOO09_22085 [Chitinophagaceae bacterium]
MTPTLLTNIKLLAGVQEGNSPLRGAELRNLSSLADAWLLLEEGLVAGYGLMDTFDDPDDFDGTIINASDQLVLPAWCDSHTHLVFPASREAEFVDKIRGVSYAEIAARGGGILNSAARLAEMSEMELLRSAWGRLQEIMQLGTGAVEIKSGYGLTAAAELKMLRVIKRLKETSPIPIKATFLGAHSYPVHYRDDHEAYIRQVIDDMLPAIADEGLADYIDVFCETGFFSAREMARICEAGKQYGLRPKTLASRFGWLAIFSFIEIGPTFFSSSGLRFRIISVDSISIRILIRRILNSLALSGSRVLKAF